MTDEPSGDDPSAAHAELLLAQRRVVEGVHAMANLLTIFRGEVDIAVDHAREALRQFFEQFPEFK